MGWDAIGMGRWDGTGRLNPALLKKTVGYVETFLMAFMEPEEVRTACSARPGVDFVARRRRSARLGSGS